jgi:hypothetical protein
VAFLVLIGLAYMQPAMPRRPVDRTPHLDGYTHFVPTEFNTAVTDMLIAKVKDIPVRAEIVVILRNTFFH